MALEWRNLQLGRNDRAILIGRTGCGKTSLAKYLLDDPNKLHSVVYDPKASSAIEKWTKTYKQYTKLSDLQYADEAKLIYTPNVYEEQDAQTQDDFFNWVYWRYYTRLYIDEAYALIGGTRPSRNLLACLSRGRERGISTITAVQRPRNFPIVLMSEAEHSYIFALRTPEDQSRVAEYTMLSVDAQMDLDEHEFYYFNVRTGLYPKKLKLNIQE